MHKGTRNPYLNRAEGEDRNVTDPTSLYMKNLPREVGDVEDVEGRSAIKKRRKTR